MKKVTNSQLTTPLLGIRPEHKDPSLAPLFVAAFLNTASRIAAQTPAYSLLFHEVASAGGMQRHHISMTTGWLMAMRSLVELACPPLLARWSDRVGRRRSSNQRPALRCLVGRTQACVAFEHYHHGTEGSCVVLVWIPGGGRHCHSLCRHHI